MWINGKVLAELVERPCLGGLSEGVLPEVIQPLGTVLIRMMPVVALLCIGSEETTLGEVVANSVQPHLLKEHPCLSAGVDCHDTEVVAESRKVVVCAGPNRPRDAGIRAH